MKPEELLNKYFDGETTCEEERELRHFFAQEKIPPGLMIYRPLFAYIENEATLHKEAPNKKKQKRSFVRDITYTLGGVAATLLLVFAIAGINRHFYRADINEVWIDGVRYTEQTIVHQQATSAFEDVSFSREDIFNVLFED